VEDPEDAVDDRAMALPGVAGTVVGRQEGLDDRIVLVADGVPELGHGRAGSKWGFVHFIVCTTVNARQTLVLAFGFAIFGHL
jgi:hypothetical protein